MDTKGRAHPVKGSSEAAAGGPEAALSGDGTIVQTALDTGSPEAAAGGPEAAQSKSKAKQAAESFAIPAAAQESALTLILQEVVSSLPLGTA